MKALLDTHTFLWFIDDNPRLSKIALEFLEADNEIFISTASLWEIAIKVNIGKLTLSIPYEKLIEDHLQQNDIEELPINHNHLVAASSLPLHHRDPFDRMLIAQAMIEALPILSADSAFDSYALKRIW